MPRGAVLTLEQTWSLAKLWYADRLNPEWRRRSVPETAAAFESLGLSDEFWSLA